MSIEKKQNNWLLVSLFPLRLIHHCTAKNLINFEHTVVSEVKSVTLHEHGIKGG
jgi:hypothetical protein